MNAIDETVDSIILDVKNENFPNRKYGKIKEYRKLLNGQKIIRTELSTCDEGLKIYFDNGYILCIGFNKDEGILWIGNKDS